MPTLKIGAAPIWSLALSAALTLLGPGAAESQGIKTSLPDSLVKQAKVTEATARKTAMAKVPAGKLQEIELERESGKLQYSYSFKVSGQDGETEVNVDAVTGAVLGVEHETAADEAKEANAAKGMKAKPAAKPKAKS